MAKRANRSSAVLVSPKPALRTSAVPMRSALTLPADLAPAGIGARVKAAADVALAGLLLAPAIPLMIVTSLLVRLTSRGPALYTQTRVGRGGRIFTLYKIRTMVHDCESLTGPRWSMPGDASSDPLPGRPKLHRRRSSLT